MIAVCWIPSTFWLWGEGHGLLGGLWVEAWGQPGGGV